MEEERELTNAYRTTNNPKLARPQGQGLNDLYVRFYRMAERCIADQTGRGGISINMVPATRRTSQSWYHRASRWM